MGVFRIGFLILKMLLKVLFGLGVGWIHFHKTTPRQTKRMFGYASLFVILMGM
jgi:hypothetical protein